MTILSSSSTLCTSMYGKVLHKLFQEAEIQSNFIPYSILKKKMNSMILHYSLESFILSNFSKELAAISAFSLHVYHFLHISMDNVCSVFPREEIRQICSSDFKLTSKLSSHFFPSCHYLLSSYL